MSYLRKESLRIVIILLPFAFLALFWTDLPARIPMHWNLQGEVNGYGSKLGLIVLAAINPAVLGLFLLVPHLNPKSQKYAFFQEKWHIVQVVLHLFLTYMVILISFIALGYQLKASIILKYSVIGLFLLTGNYLGTVGRNSFIGICTAWALSSEYVWRKTHRFTAKLWVFGSLFMFIYNNLWEKIYPWAFFVYIGVLALVPVVYSFIIYKNQPELPAPQSGE